MKLNQHIEPRLLSLQSLAQYVGASPSTVKKDIADNLLPPPCIDMPGRKRWDKKQVDQYIDRLTKPNDLLGWDDIG